MTNDDWKLKRLVIGWSNPPPGCSGPQERWVMVQNEGDDSQVAVWLEAGSLQILDSMDYYPGGCYSLPLQKLRSLITLTESGI